MTRNVPNKSALTAKQKTVIEALLSGQTQTEAAQRAGISRRTLARWMKQPQFMRTYSDAGQRLFDQAVVRLAQTSEKAVETLSVIVTDHSVPAQTRVAAARAILMSYREGRELGELAERIDELEETIRGIENE